MADPDAVWRALLPDVFAERRVGYAGARVRATTAQVPEDLVTRLHVVAVTGPGHVLVCRTADGRSFLPGGTREPGEDLAGLARRELVEEAGAVPTSPVRRFAAYAATSSLSAPYRPHQPHPLSYWAFAVASVEVTGPPTCPPGGEEVVQVDALGSDDAVAALAPVDPLHADMLRLALAMTLV